jgi:predicted RNA-binding Zn-ribbon protein involved in translation (DUF1610 family)
MSLYPADRRNPGALSARRAGAIKADYLFGGALGVIIVIAMVLAVMYSFGGRTDTKMTFRYKCDKCGAEYDGSVVPMLDKSNPMVVAPPPITCEKCGAENSAYLMTKCPKCGTYYVRPSYRNPPGVPAQIGQDVCPSCGTDFVIWMRDEPKRLRAERTGK